METKTDVQVDSQTKIAVSLTVGMIAAFCVGLSFVLFLGQSIITKTPTTTKPVPIALAFKDITSAQISVDLPGGIQPWHTVKFWGLNVTGPSNTLFGTYTNDPAQYNDGETSTRALPLMIEIDTTTHQAMIITLWDMGLGKISLNKPLPGIKTADAQVAIDKRVICIPTQKTSGTTKYFIDIDGNSYADQAMTKRLNVELCPAFVARTFTPNEIRNIVPDNDFNYPEAGTITFAKSWQTILARYTPGTGFEYVGTDNINSEAPLFITGGNSTDNSVTVPNTAFTITTDSVTKTVCFPESVLPPDSMFVYFYDENGTPFSDALLTHPVACSR